VALTTDEILDIVLPALLRKKPHSLDDGTVLQLIVPDAGARCFYRWSDGEVLVRRGVADKVDLTLSLPADDLESFLDATLDFEHGLRTRRLRLFGDASLLLPIAESMGAGA
jgi:hypothetical protein